MSKKNKNGSKPDAVKNHLKSIKDTVYQLTELTQIEGTPEQDKIIRENAQIILNSITEFIKSDTYIALKEGISAFYTYIDEHKAELKAAKKTGAELLALAPYLQLELEAVQDDPEYKNCTLEELLENGFDEKGKPIKSKFEQIIERALDRQAEFNAAAGALTEIEQAAAKLPQITYNKTKDIKTITDKLANVFYSLMAPQPKEINGQRQMIPLQYEGKNAKINITLFYDYVWNEEKLKKYGLDKIFTDFDFFVMTTLDNLFSAGNTVVSFTKIFKEMGGEGSPTTSQLEAIYHSILKGMTTIITIDDYEVQQAWNTAAGEKYHEIISPVMPAIIGNERFVANGKIVNGYVKITDFSPFWRVAAPIKHITAWDKSILKGYTGKKTNRYYSVLRFLMQQIGWMRNGNRDHKILYSALYEYTGDKTTRQQQLARDMMYRLLEEVFTPTEYISAYKEEAKPTPGVKITLCKKRLQSKK